MGRALSLDEPKPSDGKDPLGNLLVHRHANNKFSYFSSSHLPITNAVNTSIVPSTLDNACTVASLATSSAASSAASSVASSAANNANIPISSTVTPVDPLTVPSAVNSVDYLNYSSSVRTDSDNVLTATYYGPDMARRSYLINPAIELHKRGILAQEVKSGNTCLCICCLDYNCFEGRDYCLKGCICNCFMRWEGRKLVLKEGDKRKNNFNALENPNLEPDTDYANPAHICRLFVGHMDRMINILPLCLQPGCVCVCNLLFINHCMRPEGPWQRLAAAWGHR